MAKQDINVGAAANDGTGDPARTAFTKTNNNFNEVYSALGAPSNGAIPSALPINKGGTGATTAAAARANLGLGTAATATLTTSNYDIEVGRVLKVGDFGLGNSASAAYNTSWGLAPELSANSFVNYSGSSGIILKGGDASTFSQFWITTNRNTPKASFYTTIADGTSSSEVVFKTTANTTIDGNGFIKNASPIVKLFSDKIELNDEAQQQSIDFEKLGVGDYLIKNTSGFAQEGWYIEQPKDANGNVLVAVIYEQLENNDISVKTYKKKFDLETASIVADLDKPTDIPEGRWIDIRLQELPQPEPDVESESIAPPDFQPTNLSEAVQSFMNGGGYVSE